MTEPILSARRLSKSYAQGRPILRELELELSSQSITCVSGANGAGKTTLLRCIAGLVRPDSGDVSVCGHAAGSLAARQAIGFVSGDERWLAMPLTVRANLSFFARLYGLTRDEHEDRIRELGEKLDLREYLDRSVHECSAGVRALAGLARALLHRPRLLLLDEPSRSLDAAHRGCVRAVLQGHAQVGAAVLLVTHDPVERSELQADSFVLRAGVVEKDPA